MLNYKRPAFWVVIVAVVVCVVVAVCFLTNPTDDDQDLSFLNYENLVSLAAQSDRLSAHLSDESGTYEYSVKGNELAQFLDSAQWTRQRDILRSVQRDAEKSKASIQIDMHNGRYLRIFDSDTAYIYDGLGKGRYYRMQDGDYSAVLNLTDGTGQAATLSLNDVLTLSGKGADLTWSDFDAYPYTENGSGLYIRVYEIDEQFSLWIGGGPTDEPPMYIRLVSEANQGEYIDIRTEDVEAFIAEQRSSVSNVGGVGELDNVITKGDGGEWPENDYTEGVPTPPGTVSSTIIDEDQGYCYISLTDLSDAVYNAYMERLQKSGFSIIKSVSEEIQGQDYVSIGTVLSNGEKDLSISYIPGNLGIYISLTV